MNVYLDNAATTAVDKQVLDAMLPYFLENFGNPSSTHSHGRVCKAAIEKARKQVAAAINASPLEIYFTSGGTESDNTAIRGLVACHKLKHIITSEVEHHAVLHTVKNLAESEGITIHFLKLDENGCVGLDDLEELLERIGKEALVTLMHGNNELGNITDVEKVGMLCEQYGAYFHSDTVQTVGHFPIDVQKVKAHAIVGAAHKFHGPKGVGFLYLKSNCAINTFITGGGQERNMRGGTENLSGIIGLGEALALATSEMEAHGKQIAALKQYLIDKLNNNFGEVVQYNGSCNELNSLYTVVSISLPKDVAGDMLLFNLDLAGVSASGGSACSSGAAKGSHVMEAIGLDSAKRVPLRLSLSRFNTEEDIDFAIKTLGSIIEKQKQIA